MKKFFFPFFVILFMQSSVGLDLNDPSDSFVEPFSKSFESISAIEPVNFESFSDSYFAKYDFKEKTWTFCNVELGTTKQFCHSATHEELFYFLEEVTRLNNKSIFVKSQVVLAQNPIPFLFNSTGYATATWDSNSLSDYFIFYFNDRKIGICKDNYRSNGTFQFDKNSFRDSYLTDQDLTFSLRPAKECGIWGILYDQEIVGWKKE